MSKQFIHMTSGWIPIFVLSLLTTALVAGQVTPASELLPADEQYVDTLEDRAAGPANLSDPDPLEVGSIYRNIEAIKARFALQIISMAELKSDNLIQSAVIARSGVGHE